MLRIGWLETGNQGDNLLTQIDLENGHQNGVCVWVYVCYERVQGWFSPGQVFVLDEYCARYGVRGCIRHLSYLQDLLNNAERGTMIDPTLMHYSFAFCASHVHGHRYTTRAGS